MWGVICFLLLAGCSERTFLRQFAGQTMGTTYRVQYAVSASSPDIQPQVAQLLDDINRSVSTYLDTSVISQINSASDSTTWHPVDLHFERMFRRSRTIFEDTGGAFNPAVAPLIDAWGFGREATDGIPSAETIRTLLEWTAFDAFAIESHPPRMRKPHPGSKLNFNAIGEGYAIDSIAAILEGHRVAHYLIEIGGEVRAKGRHPKNRPWKVGIAKPSADALEPSSVHYAIAIEDAALSTSGNYRNYRFADGRRLSHILNPVTGYPESSSLLSVSVIADDATAADGYATALMVMGLEAGLRFVESREDLEALFFSTNPAGEIIETKSSGFPAPLNGL